MLLPKARGKQLPLVLEPGAGDEGKRGPSAMGSPDSAELLTCSCWECWDEHPSLAASTVTLPTGWLGTGSDLCLL